MYIYVGTSIFWDTFASKYIRRVMQWQSRHRSDRHRHDTKPLENRDPFKIWCQPWCICDRLNVESSRLKMKQRHCSTYKRNLPIFHINSRNIDGWWFLSKISLSQENFHFDVVLLDKMQYNESNNQFLPGCFRI